MNNEKEKRDYNYKPFEELTYDEDNIGTRLRYYQGLIDTDNLRKGQLYSDLKDSIIIFIATKDLIGKGLARYTFSNICRENKTIELNDKTLKVIYNLKGDLGTLSESERDLLSFMSDGIANSDFTKKIEFLVKNLKEKESCRTNYMTWEMESRRLKAEGRKEGIHEKAIESARNLLAMNILTPEQIAQATGLSLEEVLSLKETLRNLDKNTQ